MRKHGEKFSIEENGSLEAVERRGREGGRERRGQVCLVSRHKQQHITLRCSNFECSSLLLRLYIIYNISRTNTYVSFPFPFFYQSFRKMISVKRKVAENRLEVGQNSGEAWKRIVGTIWVNGGNDVETNRSSSRAFFVTFLLVYK